MNIQITQISNGFLVAIAKSPTEQMAIYVETFPQVLDQLREISTPPENVAKLPTDRK